MSESLKGKTAVISGAASGFAKATAELFAKLDQCNLVIYDLNEAGLAETAKSCEAFGSKVVSFKGDVTKPETSEKALLDIMIPLLLIGHKRHLYRYLGYP